MGTQYWILLYNCINQTKIAKPEPRLTEAHNINVSCLLGDLWIHHWSRTTHEHVAQSATRVAVLWNVNNYINQIVPLTFTHNFARQ